MNCIRIRSVLKEVKKVINSLNNYDFYKINLHNFWMYANLSRAETT